MTRLEDLGKARQPIKSSAVAKGNGRQRKGAETSVSILHLQNHTSRCVDTGNANVALRVEPVTGLLNTHLFQPPRITSANLCFITSLLIYIHIFYIFLKNTTYQCFLFALI